MSIIKILLTGMLMVSAGMVQGVNISGIVTDTGGVAIAGAAVSLEKGGQTAASAADGRFTLSGGTNADNDVIAVTKDGYLNYRVISTNPDTSEIKIEMIVCAGTVTDIDGNVYQVVKIGAQVWTVENLRTTKYNDGTPISFDITDATWFRSTTPKYCYYNNTTNADSIRKFGALYNAYVVNTRKLAPVGWHVPTEAEWDILTGYLISNRYNWDPADDNTIAKSLAAKTDWVNSDSLGTPGNDLTKNNRTGFSALPGGVHKGGVTNGFHFVGENAHFISAGVDGIVGGKHRNISRKGRTIGIGGAHTSCGFSVRLLRSGIVKDSTLSLDTMLLDFYAFSGGMYPADPVVRLTNFGIIPVPALSATTDSAWLHVSISGTGNSQVIHHTIDLGSLATGKVNSSRVRLFASGYYSLDYTVNIRAYERLPHTIRIEPDTLRVQRNQQAHIVAKAMDDRFMSYTDPGKLNWSVSGGGSIDSAGLFKSDGSSGIFTVKVEVASNPTVKDSGIIIVTLSTGCDVTASSSYESSTWGVRNLTDGMMDKGYTSDCNNSSDDEWVEVDLGGDNVFSRVVLYPRYGFYADDGKSYGFPVDFTLTAKTAAGVQTTLLTRTNYPCPDSGAPQVFDFDAVTARYLRLTVTGFAPPVTDICRLQLAEMEIIDVNNLVNEMTIPSPLYFGLNAVPNPFSASTLVKFSVPQAKNGEKQKVSVRIYDLNGRLVQTLAQGSFAAGVHTVVFKGKGKENEQTLGNGVYFCRMQAPGFSRTLKLLLVE